MYNRRTCLVALFLISDFMLILPAPVHAYIDPGSGSYVIQAALASVFGALFLIKSYWISIKNFVMSKFSKPKTQ